MAEDKFGKWIDQYYEDAVALVRRTKKCEAVHLQRNLRIGYPTAARLLDIMEDEGIISERGNDGQREVFPVKQCPVCKSDLYSEDEVCVNCYLYGFREWPEDQSSYLLERVEKILQEMLDGLKDASDKVALIKDPLDDDDKFWMESKHIWRDRIYHLMGSYRDCLAKCRPYLLDQEAGDVTG